MLAVRWLTLHTLPAHSWGCSEVLTSRSKPFSRKMDPKVEKSSDLAQQGLVELSPSMADNISSSDESSSDRPLREALLQSDTHSCRAPGTYIHLPRGRGVDEMTHPSGAPRCQREVPEPRAGWRSHRRVPGKAQQPTASLRQPAAQQQAEGIPQPPVQGLVHSSPGFPLPSPADSIQDGYTTGTQSL